MDPTFGLCFHGRLSTELSRAGARVEMLGEVRFSRPWTIWFARRRLRRFLSDAGIDAVICHSPWPHALFAPVVRRCGLPLAFWLHDAVQGRHWLELWARRTPPDVALCNSDFTAGLLPNLHPGVRAATVHCPVAPDEQTASPADRAAVRRELNTSEEAVVVIQASRLEKWKGHRLQLAALAGIRDLPNWVCWQVGGSQRAGESEYLAELKSEAGRLGIADRVRFVGQRTDVPRLLKAADIHCQPNVGPEPFGIAFVEALYAGLPVVSTSIGAIPEIVDESCGILVPPGDAGALSDALRSLVADAPRRRRLGACGPARADRICNPRTQLSRIQALLGGLVRSSAAN